MIRLVFAEFSYTHISSHILPTEMGLRKPGSNECTADDFWNKDVFFDGPFSGSDETAEQLELATLAINAIQPIVGDGNCGYRFVSLTPPLHDHHH